MLELRFASNDILTGTAPLISNDFDLFWAHLMLMIDCSFDSMLILMLTSFPSAVNGLSKPSLFIFPIVN
jgi:hypothetical protein